MSSRSYILLLLVSLLGCNTNEAPTGISSSDIEGIWSGTLVGVTLMGRSLSGDVDWRFDRRTFEIFFFDPLPGQAKQISGDWKFSDERMVLTLRSSFPVASDAGATDSLFVSVFQGQLSLQTQSGSAMLLQKIQGVARALPLSPFRKTELFGA